MMNDYNPEDKTETTDDHDELSQIKGQLKSSNRTSSQVGNQREKFSSSNYQSSPNPIQDRNGLLQKKNDFLKYRTPSEELANRENSY